MNKDMKLLTTFKEKYDLTWPELANVFGRSLSAVENWHKRKMLPLPYKTLMQIYIDQPQMLKKYRLDKK